MSQLTIDPTLTLNEITVRYPAALGVLNAYGLDACCGGALPLAEAARRHGLDEAELQGALEQAISGFDDVVRAAVEKGDIA